MLVEESSLPYGTIFPSTRAMRMVEKQVYLFDGWLAARGLPPWMARSPQVWRMHSHPIALWKTQRRSRMIQVFHVSKDTASCCGVRQAATRSRALVGHAALATACSELMWHPSDHILRGFAGMQRLEGRLAHVRATEGIRLGILIRSWKFWKFGKSM